MSRFRSALCLLSLFLFSSAFAQNIIITQVEQKRDRGYDYLDVYATGSLQAKGLLLEDKLFLDFPGAKFSSRLKISRKKSKRIKDIRAAQKDATTARIIVTLKKEIDYDITNVFGRDKTVIEVSDRQININQLQFAWESVELKKKAAPLKPSKLEPVISERKLALKGKVVILDPGHGGDDPGCLSANNIAEKHLTLKTAQAAARVLRQNGATVYLTRNEDRRSNLEDITRFADKVGADIFISIHYNAINLPSIAGTETYYYNPVSRRFAEKMHTAVVEGIKRKDRGLHRVRFYTIHHTRMPSVLLEPVYISNPGENSLVNSAEFQEKLAGSIAKGVMDYFRSKSD